MGCTISKTDYSPLPITLEEAGLSNSPLPITLEEAVFLISQ